MRSQKEVGEVFREMPLTFRHWLCGIVLLLSLAVDAWELMILILIGDLISSAFHVGPARIGSLIGAIFLGMIPGSLIWGKISDVLGRKRTVVSSFCGYGVISLVGAFSVSYSMLWWMRFVAGIAVAGVVVTTFPWFEELLPVKTRGEATVYLVCGWPVGFLIAIGAAYALRGLGWHWILAISALGSLWALVIWLVVPESPYWAAGNDRQEVARESIRYLAVGRLQMDLDEMDLSVERHRRGSFTELFQHNFFGVTLLQFFINFCFAWGYWGLTSWMPKLLSDRGLSVPQGYGFLALSAIFMFPGYVGASWLTGRHGRKKIMVTFVTLAALCGFAFAKSGTLWEMYLWNFGLSFFTSGAWGVWDTWLGEIYPTEIRGSGYSVGVTAQRFATYVAPLVTGLLLARKAGFYQIVAFVSLFLAVVAISALFVKETEGEILQ